jgi:hypothetical protein
MISVPRHARELDTSFGRVAWSRGEGCLPLATCLSEAAPIQVSGDLRQSCVSQRIDLLVTRRLSSFDLVPIIVPHQVDLERVQAVTAAVGDGPHSQLAVAVAMRIGDAIDVPAELATVYRAPDEISAATARLSRLANSYPKLGQRAVNAPNAARLIDSLSPGTLLVVGAPGGSWLQRQLYGTGHRLLVTAPCGVVVVRSAPRRCYQSATDPTGVALGCHLTVGDALRLMTYAVVPVVDERLLVGVVRVSSLADVDPTLPIAAVMEPPVAIAGVEPRTAVADLRDFFGDSPVPVVDAAGYLIGTIPNTRPFTHGEPSAP